MIQHKKFFNYLKLVKDGGISSENEFKMILEEGSHGIFIFNPIVGIVHYHSDRFSFFMLHISSMIRFGVSITFHYPIDLGPLIPNKFHLIKSFRESSLDLLFYFSESLMTSSRLNKFLHTLMVTKELEFFFTDTTNVVKFPLEFRVSKRLHIFKKSVMIIPSIFKHFLKRVLNQPSTLEFKRLRHMSKILVHEGEEC